MQHVRRVHLNGSGGDSEGRPHSEDGEGWAAAEVHGARSQQLLEHLWRLVSHGRRRS